MRLSIAFALTLGVLIGVCGTMGLHINRPGPDAGDWLAFGGALVGVTLTIAGTLWLESYRARVSAKADESVLTNALAQIRSDFERATRERGAEAIDLERARRITDEGALLHSFDKMSYARHYVPARNTDTWHAIEELSLSLSRERALLEREIRLISDAGDNEAVLGVNISIMNQIADRVSPHIEQARSLLASDN